LTENGLRVSICNQENASTFEFQGDEDPSGPKQCEGNERSAAVAPEVFEVRDDQAHLPIENPPAALME
jgi:hypothetical protein